MNDCKNNNGVSFYGKLLSCVLFILLLSFPVCAKFNEDANKGKNPSSSNSSLRNITLEIKRVFMEGDYKKMSEIINKKVFISFFSAQEDYKFKNPIKEFSTSELKEILFNEKHFKERVSLNPQPNSFIEVFGKLKGNVEECFEDCSKDFVEVDGVKYNYSSIGISSGQYRYAIDLYCKDSNDCYIFGFKIW